MPPGPPTIYRLPARLPPCVAPAGRTDQYQFVRVAGDGVHEIPVGPVHAGIIEPGHFRFSVVGEKVLKLEERLGYVHKGIEQRFTQLPACSKAIGSRRACRAIPPSPFPGRTARRYEGMAQATIPARAAWLRALALESERIANHLGDLGALGNDAGFAFGLAQFSRLKEQWLRATAASVRTTLPVRFRGTRRRVRRIAGDGARAARDLRARDIAAESAALRAIYDEHAGVRDRFAAAGTVTPELAARLGLCGLAGRASGQAFDLRCDLPCDPYDELSVRKISRREGDVAARVAVRFDELQESLRLDAAQSCAAFLPGRIPARCFAADRRRRLGLGLDRGLARPGAGRA